MDEKLVKVIFEYEDGTRKYIDKRDLEKWIRINESITGFAMSHGFEPEWGEIKWKPVKINEQNY